jgi:hypothetical protein
MVRWGTMTLRAWRGLREFLAVQVELHERMALLDRPWEEEFLHWAGDDGHELHGRLVPPPGPHRSTTRSGWCPGLARNHGASSRTGSRSR